MIDWNNVEKALNNPIVKYSVQVMDSIDIGLDVQAGDGYTSGYTAGAIEIYNEIARVRSKDGLMQRIAGTCGLIEEYKNKKYQMTEDAFSVYSESDYEWYDIIRIVPIYEEA